MNLSGFFVTKLVPSRWWTWHAWRVVLGKPSLTTGESRCLKAKRETLWHLKFVAKKIRDLTNTLKLKLTGHSSIAPKNGGFPIGISFSRGLFSEAMLVSGRVYDITLESWIFQSRQDFLFFRNSGLIILLPILSVHLLSRKKIQCIHLSCKLQHLSWTFRPFWIKSGFSGYLVTGYM